MSDIVDESLRKITRGAILVFIGTIVGTLLGMVSRVIIVRSITQNEYGIYSLGVAIISIVAVISLLGMHPGLSRQIAFYRGKDDELKIRGLVLSSVGIGLFTGLFFSLIIFFCSDIIAVRFFHNSELAIPLKILSIVITADVLIIVLSSVFRGFNKAEPSMYFEHILRQVFFLLFLVPVFFLGLQFKGIIYAFTASYLITLAVFIIYTVRKLPISIKGNRVDLNRVSKELLLFSLPLLAVALARTIATQTDTLMIGYYMASDDVGLYNAALPLVHVIPIPLGALGFLSLPLMSQLYAKGQIDEIKKIYASLTKWIFSTTVPVFLVFVLFSSATLNVFFGLQYVDAATAMIILSIGFFCHAILGPNGNTLVVMGQTRFYMWMVLLSLAANVVLNVLLIPIWGINGAAIATSSTIIIRNFLLSAKLYSIARINPFTMNFLKPAISSIVLACGIQWVVKSLFSDISLWLLPLLFILFLILYILCVLVTKSFDREDIMMLDTVEKKTGIRLTALKKVLKKFE